MNPDTRNDGEVVEKGTVPKFSPSKNSAFSFFEKKTVKCCDDVCKEASNSPKSTPEKEESNSKPETDKLVLCDFTP